MKVIKSLLLGSAAGIAAVAAAQAADLPSRKSAPAEYVKICDAYGAGFFYIPGTDTCLRVGGYVRAEYGYAQAVNAVAVPAFTKYTGGGFTAAAPGFSANATVANTTLIPSGVEDQTGFMARGRLEMDARTQSPYGTVRTFIALRAINTSGLYADNYQTTAVTGQTGSTSITVENAIVQFAGFTFGRTNGEIFTFMPGSDWFGRENAGFPGGINLLSYTATFGGGFSGTLGIEDRAGLGFSSIPAYNTYNFFNAAAGNALFAPAGTFNSVTNTAAFVNGPLTWPALTANLRVDQGWGAVQVMGQVVQNAASSNFATVTSTGSPNITLTQTGWAVGAGIKLNLPMIAAGDTLYATAAYANGDLDMLFNANTSANTGTFGREFGGLERIDRNLYVSPVGGTAGSCSVSTTQSTSCYKTEQTTGWSTAAAFTHYWTPSVRSVFHASYAQINPGNVTKNTDWTLGGLSSANVFRLAAQLIWSPTKDLDIGTEVGYGRLNQSLAHAPGYAASCQAGTQLLTGTAVIPAACAALGNVSPSSSIWEARIRIVRQF